jgi:hypothetical protein
MITVSPPTGEVDRYCKRKQEDKINWGFLGIRPAGFLQEMRGFMLAVPHILSFFTDWNETVFSKAPSIAPDWHKNNAFVDFSLFLRNQRLSARQGIVPRIYFYAYIFTY